jgi:hypothetical protein
MRALLATSLLICLAACSGSRDQQEFVTAPTAPPQHSPPVDPTTPPNSAAAVPRYETPSARAAAPKMGEPDTTHGNLMDCTTESCRINCSPKVAARARPKWCANFKEPI